MTLNTTNQSFHTFQLMTIHHHTMFGYKIASILGTCSLQNTILSPIFKISYPFQLCCLPAFYPPPPPPNEPVPTELLLALIKVQFVKFSFKKSPATFPKSTLCQRPICVLTHFNYLNIIWIMYAHVCDEAGTSSTVCICSVNVFLCTLTVVPQFQQASVEC